MIAWYHPQDGSASNEQYFLIKGQAALVGTLFGSIDFVIIKAEVHLLAKASAMVLIEAHQPTQVELKLLVEVSASVKILFFTVSFSFRMELDLAFTVGSASPTPWIVTAPPKDRLSLRQSRGLYAPRILKPAHMLAILRAAEGSAIEWNWEPRQFFSAKRKLLLSAAPSFTPALRRDTATGHRSPGAVDAEQHSGQRAYRSRSHASPDERAGEVPFNALVEGVLRWAINALPRTTRSW